MNVLKIVEEKLKWCPFYSQENAKDQVVYAKLFDVYGSTSWYITEYDSKIKTAFWFVQWLNGCPSDDEWWYFNLKELSELKYWSIPRIEIDLYFWIKKFSEVKRLNEYYDFY